MQRTGTTSVGKFFRDFGFRWAGWPSDKKNDWSGSCYVGDIEAIFTSCDFKNANAFEDSPWFYPEFYKILYQRFPNSKFILFTRDPDAWFNSMLKHSNGDIIGRAMVHCKVYRRELEYYSSLHIGEIPGELENRLNIEKKMKLSDHPEHYKEVYRLHNIEIQEYFKLHSPESLFVCQLEDPGKWVKLGAFLDIQVPADYFCHENNSDIQAKNKSKQ